MYPFFESIRILNGKPMNLEFHQTRLNKTFNIFYPNVLNHNLQKLITQTPDISQFSGKLRFSYSSLQWKIELIDYTSFFFNDFRMVFTQNFSYPYKFSERLWFESIKESHKEFQEVIIVKNGFITDASAYNLAFFNGTKWITPSTPLLEGTMRASLLSLQIIHLGEIKASDLYLYKKFKLINALNPFETSVEYNIDQIYNNL